MSNKSNIEELGQLLDEAGVKLKFNMHYPFRKWTLRFDGAREDGHIMSYGKYDKPHSKIEDVHVIELAAYEKLETDAGAICNAYGAQGVELHDTKKKLEHALQIAADRKAEINRLRLKKR